MLGQAVHPQVHTNNTMCRIAHGERFFLCRWLTSHPKDIVWIPSTRTLPVLQFSNVLGLELFQQWKIENFWQSYQARASVPLTC